VESFPNGVRAVRGSEGQQWRNLTKKDKLEVLDTKSAADKRESLQNMEGSARKMWLGIPTKKNIDTISECNSWYTVVTYKYCP
jgi:hypothetical protein